MDMSRGTFRLSWLGSGAVLAVLAGAVPAAAQSCVGDCDGDGRVEINELVLGVSIALGADDISACAALDDGNGVVTIDRLIAAVNNALCDCAACEGGTATPTATAATPGETPTGATPTATPTGATPTATATGPTPTPTATGPTPTATGTGTTPTATGTPPTPTPTPTGSTPTPTQTGGVSVSMWTVDDYEVTDSDCAGVLEDAALDGLREIGPEFIVRQSGSDLEIEDDAGNIYDGTVDPNGIAHVQFTNSDSVVTCDYDVDVEASADLRQSPTTATYDMAVNLSGFCLGFSDCDLEVTARWRRLDVAASR